MSKRDRVIDFNYDLASYDLLREAQLDSPDKVFAHERLNTWRLLVERDNSTLEVETSPREFTRLHIKRDRLPGKSRVRDEVTGAELLDAAGISSIPIIAHGADDSGRTFLISQHLAGYRSADRLLEAGVPFSQLLDDTAKLVAQLHAARLHHRDLYLNHFYVRTADKPQWPLLRLIDAARVRRLPRLLPGRWIMKDLAQFLFSAMQANVSKADQRSWLALYCRERGRRCGPLWRMWVFSKARAIARQDAISRRSDPRRNQRVLEE